MENRRKAGPVDAAPCRLAVILHALELLLDVDTTDKLAFWLSEILPTMLPGGAVFCGIGRSDDTGIRPQELVHVGFLDEDLCCGNPDGSVSWSPLIREALLSASVRLCESAASTVKGGKSRHWPYRLEDMVTTAGIDPTSGTVSFMSVAVRRVTGEQGAEHRRTLSLLAPVLHSVLRRIVRRDVHAAPTEVALPLFTAREKEIIHWMMLGKSNWSIAIILGSTESTVKSQLKGIFNKLGVAGRTQAAARLTELGRSGKPGQ